jgi:hypothetical protein
MVIKMLIAIILSLSYISHVDHVRAVGDIFVVKGIQYLVFVKDENPRHLKGIACGLADEVTFYQARHEGPVPIAYSEQGFETHLAQAELFVQPLVGIRYVAQVAQVIHFQYFTGHGAVYHVYNDNVKAIGGNIAFLIGDVGHGFPAKCTAKMAQKNEE